FVGIFGGVFVGDLSCQPGGGNVQLPCQRFHAVVGLRQLGGVEGVGFDNIRTGVQIFRVDIAEQGRLGKVEQIVIALDIAVVILEPIAPESGFVQFLVLDHGAHGTVKNNNPFLEGLV